MPRAHYLQTAFNAGLLDPRLAARTDIQQFYQGMSQADNVVAVPMGGVKRRPGLALLEKMATRLTPRATEAQIDTITAPNGGETDNALDLDPATFLTTTTDIGTTNPYVVLHIDFGAPLSGNGVKFADVNSIRLTSGSSAEFRIQYSTDDSVWLNFGDSFQLVDTGSRNYRRRGDSNARYWRLVRVGSSDLGSAKVELAMFKLFSEVGTYLTDKSELPRLVPFEFSLDQSYLLVCSTGNVAIYRDDNLRADVDGLIDESDDYAQLADTMIVCRETRRPQQLVRRTLPADTSNDRVWEFKPVEFTNIPEFDFNDERSPVPVSEVQTLTFQHKDGSSASPWEEGDRFSLDLGGAETVGITFAGVSNAAQRNTTAENIRRELQKLPTVKSDTGISVAWTSGSLFTVTFADGSADSYDLIGAFPLTGSDDNKIAVARTATGSSRREPAWSDARGWPRAVTFANGRLWMGGTTELPTSFWASTAFDLFDFEVGQGLPDEALFNTILSESLNSIVHIFAGRDLSLFTQGSESRFPREVLTPENAIPSIQTRYGVARVKPVSIDGTTLFIQRTRKVLREFVFDLNQDAYLAPPLSALAPFVLNDVRGMAVWQGSGDDETNLVLLVNNDGSMAVLSTLKQQDVNAWTRWTTDGQFKSVAVVNQDIYALVSRGAAQYVERFDPGFYTDNAVQQSLGSPSDTITGLDHLNGVECRVRADGNVLTNVTPSGGSATLEIEATDVEVGRNFDVLIKTMPLNSDFGNGDNFLRKKRLVKARLSVFETLGVRINGKRLPDRQMDVSNLDEAPIPFTGAVEIETTSGWDFTPLVIPIEVLDPVPFELLGMDLQVETS